MKLLMIADDFTGALDAGVQFAKKGFSTKVLVYSKDMSFQAEDADVLVVDAETCLLYTSFLLAETLQ